MLVHSERGIQFRLNHSVQCWVHRKSSRDWMWPISLLEDSMLHTDSWLSPHQVWLQDRNGSRLTPIPSWRDTGRLIFGPWSECSWMSHARVQFDEKLRLEIDRHKHEDCFFCYFPRFGCSRKALMRKLSRWMPVLRCSGVLGHSIDGSKDSEWNRT
jgi:hypothetical protein